MLNDGHFRHKALWRGSGMAVPIFSLRTHESVGCGEFMDCMLAVDLLNACGIRVLQVLTSDSVAKIKSKIPETLASCIYTSCISCIYPSCIYTSCIYVTYYKNKQFSGWRSWYISWNKNTGGHFSPTPPTVWVAIFSQVLRLLSFVVPIYCLNLVQRRRSSFSAGVVIFVSSNGLYDAFCFVHLDSLDSFPFFVVQFVRARLFQADWHVVDSESLSDVFCQCFISTTHACFRFMLFLCNVSIIDHFMILITDTVEFVSLVTVNSTWCQPIPSPWMQPKSSAWIL